MSRVLSILLYRCVLVTHLCPCTQSMGEQRCTVVTEGCDCVNWKPCLKSQYRSIHSYCIDFHVLFVYANRSTFCISSSSSSVYIPPILFLSLSLSLSLPVSLHLFLQCHKVFEAIGKAFKTKVCTYLHLCHWSTHQYI